MNGKQGNVSNGRGGEYNSKRLKTKKVREYKIMGNYNNDNYVKINNIYLTDEDKGRDIGEEKN